MASAPPFNCKGGSYTKIIRSLVKNYLGANDTSDDHPRLNWITRIYQKIGSLLSHFRAPSDEDITARREISNSLSYIDSIQTNLSQKGTTSAKGNSDILTSQVTGLRQEAGELSSQLINLDKDCSSLPQTFRTAGRSALTEMDNPEPVTELRKVEEHADDNDRSIKRQIISEKTLAARFASADETARQLLISETDKTKFKAMREAMSNKPK